jgi:hypothetical protein
MLESYKNFFVNGSGFPKFKSKHDNRQSCRFPEEAISSNNDYSSGKLTLTKSLKNVKFRCSDEYKTYLNKYKSGIKSATLTKTKSGNYFLSVLIDGELEKQVSKPINDIIGIDLGTRDFNMKSSELALEKRCCRITLDGDKISDNYKIRPYFDLSCFSSGKPEQKEEKEERIYFNNDNTWLDLKKYCIRIDILDEPIYGKTDKRVDCYTFQPNNYLCNQKVIEPIYNEFKGKIKALNSDIPIFFVDKMRPFKLNESILFEAKQVGIIYHFTSLYSFFCMVSNIGNLSKKENTINIVSGRDHISFTRNYNMRSYSIITEKRNVRISIDGDKLSNKYKIKPHLDQEYQIDDKEEREERIKMNKNQYYINITDCIIQVDILNEPIVDYNKITAGDSYYTFPRYDNILRPFRTTDIDDIKEYYSELLEKVIEKKSNFNFPINIVDKMKQCKLNENITDFDIMPPKKKQNNLGGNNYLYYAIFEELYIPKNLVKLLSSTDIYPGGYVMKKIYQDNPYRIGMYEFKILPKYVDSKIINGQKYDKIILNDYLKTPVRLNEEKIEKLHKELIFNIFNKLNTENINLEEIFKFNLFSAFENPQIDDDMWENITDGYYE